MCGPQRGMQAAPTPTPPMPEAPPPAPTVRDATIDGVRSRQQAAQRSRTSGLASTYASDQDNLNDGFKTTPTLG